ncbi:DUF3391 domain-containing protein [Pseudoduganella sp. FT93W]|uniref:DUF3391 domain-containing protein n=1 Tax=Duganella fentianensis TaxID=2692177 RepID=A0A845I1J1_9BURK|nr:HD-GYP domain-containing protein [Duganella fentianensis]MYN47454.1 DUF3391 domain-containing protein [Duganella fentianensis]
MFKKITVDQAQIGMYVHKVCGTWLDNPFWTASFALKSASDLKKLQSSTAREIWIDTTRGLDVATAVTQAAPPTPATTASATPATPVAAASSAVSVHGTPPEFRFKVEAPTSTSDELKRAKRIVKTSREAVDEMFNDARMGKLISTETAVQLADEITASVLRNPGALISLVRLKKIDDYTYMHSVAVCAMMVALGRQLNLPDHEVRDCGLAGLLHDVGKMAIPIEILNKPGRLTESEYSTIQGHPRAGFELLAQTGNVPAIARDVCLHHHERVDGKGYPDALPGDQISLQARMGAICDVYDAITSNRPYKEGWSPVTSLARMTEWTKEGQFDATLFAAFVRCIGIYPIGTLVRLKSDRLAVVLDNRKSLLAPIVRVIYSLKSMVYLPPETLDLALPGTPEAILSSEEEATWGIVDCGRFMAD